MKRIFLLILSFLALFSFFAVLDFSYAGTIPSEAVTIISEPSIKLANTGTDAVTIGQSFGWRIL